MVTTLNFFLLLGKDDKKNLRVLAVTQGYNPNFFGGAIRKVTRKVKNKLRVVAVTHGDDRQFFLVIRER